MDYLREGIHLRGFAQIDPLVAYKNEGFTMFHELMNSIWEEFARVIYHVEVNIEPADLGARARGPAVRAVLRGRRARAALRDRRGRRAVGARRPPPAPGVIPASPSGGGGGNGGASENPETVVKADRDKIGRNDPCWCGSARSTRSATAPNAARATKL